MTITTSKDAGLLSTTCKVCQTGSAYFGEAEVLKKHRVRYFRCGRCGFIQTEQPYWLDEAYSSAIGAQDVGVIQRNLINCEITSAVLKCFFPRVSTAVDFAGGHGMLVRLMRDRGFNFFWTDPYAANEYARGFESPEGATFEFLTAFEVLEHFVNPVEGLAGLMKLSRNVFVSTCLIPQPVPRLPDWWYYMPAGGQHVSFYTEQSLQLLAKRFGRYLLSAGSYHFLAEKPVNPLAYRMVIHPRIARILNLVHRRRSLIGSDFEKMLG